LLHIEAAGHRLAEMLRGQNADYVEGRLEQRNSSHISYRGRRLETIGRSSAIGGNVRALVKDGWGFAAAASWPRYRRWLILCPPYLSRTR
jgi:TldD protein